MKFSVVKSIRTPAKSRVYLVQDNWNDWFTYTTLYSLSIVDDNGTLHSIGYVKIGEKGMSEDQSSPNLPQSFDSLEPEFFSLGQAATYYENLNKLGPDVRQFVLANLNDVAADLDLYEEIASERVTRESLMRSVNEKEVQNQYHRMTQGRARLTKFRFSYEIPKTKNVEPIKLEFKVLPESRPPTNIHVLIGRNGVGKTFLLSKMTKAITLPRSRNSGQFEFHTGFSDTTSEIRNVVSVSFSAFDKFQSPSSEPDKELAVNYSYIGLKRFTGKYRGRPKSEDLLAKEFVESCEVCIIGEKRKRWLSSLKNLESDPIFNEANVAEIAQFKTQEEREDEALKIFERLSSGHKIVLLTTTRLVEEVGECTLVLLDEPEAHLHPPLLSAFVRSLSDLLIDQNGVAIVATHSPVILQEVPKNCAWKLRRNGLVVSADRPEIETFGENVGTLTREAFGLEVTQSGFHKLIQQCIESGKTYESILDEFDEQLGTEARALAMTLSRHMKDN